MESSSHKKTMDSSNLRARMYGYGRRSDYQRRPVLESRSLVLDIRGPRMAQKPTNTLAKKLPAVSSGQAKTLSHMPSRAVASPLFINDIKPGRKQVRSQPAHVI